MFALALIWVATGLLIGTVGLLVWGRPAGASASGGWGALARIGLDALIVATITLSVAWATSALEGRVAATTAAPGVALVAALAVTFAPRALRRGGARSAE